MMHFFFTSREEKRKCIILRLNDQCGDDYDITVIADVNL